MNHLPQMFPNSQHSSSTCQLRRRTAVLRKPCQGIWGAPRREKGHTKSSPNPRQLHHFPWIGLPLDCMGAAALGWSRSLVKERSLSWIIIKKSVREYAPLRTFLKFLPWGFSFGRGWSARGRGWSPIDQPSCVLGQLWSSLWPGFTNSLLVLLCAFPSLEGSGSVGLR